MQQQIPNNNNRFLFSMLIETSKNVAHAHKSETSSPRPKEMLQGFGLLLVLRMLKKIDSEWI